MQLPNIDKFRVLGIFLTENLGEEWLMDMENPDADKRFNPKRKLLEIPMALGRTIETSQNGGVSFNRI